MAPSASATIDMVVSTATDCRAKYDLYDMLVKQPGSQVSNPIIEISPEQVDKAYLLVKKMERFLRGFPDSLRNYYAHSIGKIEEAYLSADFNAFKSGLASLMGDVEQQ